MAGGFPCQSIQKAWRILLWKFGIVVNSWFSNFYPDICTWDFQILYPTRSNPSASQYLDVWFILGCGAVRSRCKFYSCYCWFRRTVHSPRDGYRGGILQTVWSTLVTNSVRVPSSKVSYKDDNCSWRPQLRQWFRSQTSPYQGIQNFESSKILRFLRLSEFWWKESLSSWHLRDTFKGLRLATMRQEGWR